MIKNEQIKIMKEILENVKEMTTQDEWVNILMGPAIGQMSRILLTGDLSDERLKRFKDVLHTVDSIIAGMDNHGLESGKEVDHQRMFTLLYSMYDMLNDIKNESQKEEEETDASD
jgi:3-deoxy-D-manno-octulosonic-acid transferase